MSPLQGAAITCANRCSSPIDQSDDGERKVLDRADYLRLRKRTRCGRDHLLKRTLVLVKKLRQTYDDLKRTHAPQTSKALSAGTSDAVKKCAKSRATDDSCNQGYFAAPRPTSAAVVPISLSARCFLDAAEARYLCSVHPDNTSHILMDCNSIWSTQMLKPKDQLVGQLVRDLFSPASWARFTVGIEMLRSNGVIMVRNVPSYKPGLVVDALVWGEFTRHADSDDSNVEHSGLSATPAQILKSTMHCVQIVEINPRPLTSVRSPKTGGDAHMSTDMAARNNDRDTLSRDSTDSDDLALSHMHSTDVTAPAPVQLMVNGEHDLCRAQPSLTALTDTVASVPVQCAVFLPLHQPDYVDPEVCISPWRTDGTDRVGELTPPSVVKRSQLARILPHSVASDLLLPCSVQPSVQPAALDVAVIDDNMNSLDACHAMPCASTPGPDNSNKMHVDPALEPIVRYFQVHASCT